MKITTDHPASRFGRPVVVADGRVLGHPEGLLAVRERLGLTTAQIAAACGKSVRTAEGWFQGRAVPTECLIVLGELLEHANRWRRP